MLVSYSSLVGVLVGVFGTPRTYKRGEALEPELMLDLSALAAAYSTGFHARKWAKVCRDRQEWYRRKIHISFVIVCYPLSALEAGLAAYALGQGRN